MYLEKPVNGSNRVSLASLKQQIYSFTHANTTSLHPLLINNIECTSTLLSSCLRISCKTEPRQTDSNFREYSREKLPNLITCKEISTIIIRPKNSDDVIYATSQRRCLRRGFRLISATRLGSWASYGDGRKRGAAADLCFLGERSLSISVTPPTASCSSGGALLPLRREVEQRKVGDRCAWGSNLQ